MRLSRHANTPSQQDCQSQRSAGIITIFEIVFDFKLNFLIYFIQIFDVIHPKLRNNIFAIRLSLGISPQAIITLITFECSFYTPQWSSLFISRDFLCSCSWKKIPSIIFPQNTNFSIQIFLPKLNSQINYAKIETIILVH